MFHITEIQGHGSRAILSDIFNNVNSGNTILLLGAGASITERNNYLSSELMDLHKAESGSNYDTDNIRDYVDILSKNPGFDRDKSMT